jgi:integrase
MKKIRTLHNGHIVTLHDNDGLRKRCRCARRAWATCGHPWAFSFTWKAGHHRFPIDKYAERPIVTKDEARDEADRLRRLIRAGGFPPPATPAATTPEALTFATFAERWRTTARAALSDTLTASDKAISRRLSDLVIDGQRLATWPIGLITEDVMEAAFAQLRGLAGSTWDKYRGLILKSQRWGLKKGYLSRAWLSDDNEQITHRKPGKRTRRLVPDVLDDKGKLKQPGEERRLLDTAGPWLQRLIIAALETCCRRGELLSLQWCDVTLTRNELKIRDENAKDEETRVLPISPRLLAVLTMIDKDPAGNPHKPAAFVFGDKIGRQIKDPKKAWLTACKLAGIRDLRFHDLRHEAASRLTEAGWPIHHVSEMLGHADLKTTSRYVNVTLKGLHASMARLGSGGQPLHDVAHGAEAEPGFTGNAEQAETTKVVVN